MKLTVAGRDRTGDLGADISEAAATLPASDAAPDFLPYEYSALSLNSAQNDSGYLSIFVRLLWARTGVDLLDFYIPRKKGVRGWTVAAVKRCFWKLLRYQHDQVGFHQNTINSQFAAAIEFMHAEHAAEVAELQKRIEQLEKAR